MVAVQLAKTWNNGKATSNFWLASLNAHWTKWPLGSPVLSQGTGSQQADLPDHTPQLLQRPPHPSLTAGWPGGDTHTPALAACCLSVVGTSPEGSGFISNHITSPPAPAAGKGKVWQWWQSVSLPISKTHGVIYPGTLVKCCVTLMIAKSSWTNNCHQSPESERAERNSHWNGCWMVL